MNTRSVKNNPRKGKTGPGSCSCLRYLPKLDWYESNSLSSSKIVTYFLSTRRHVRLSRNKPEDIRPPCTAIRVLKFRTLRDFSATRIHNRSNSLRVLTSGSSKIEERTYEVVYVACLISSRM
eukprot:Lithocolla_globosa_v1_NODE_2726_length_1890_cov_4.540054.p2 type:complete len:122 gc:universal NODE_2726_length_1890_cov_4.540054:235-600(+)